MCIECRHHAVESGGESPELRRLVAILTIETSHTKSPLLAYRARIRCYRYVGVVVHLIDIACRSRHHERGEVGVPGEIGVEGVLDLLGGVLHHQLVVVRQLTILLELLPDIEVKGRTDEGEGSALLHLLAPPGIVGETNDEITATLVDELIVAVERPLVLDVDHTVLRRYQLIRIDLDEALPPESHE